MSKVEIVYIGPKKVKKDTVTGSRQIFPRHKAVPVEADIAHRLLDYPDVFVLAEDAKDVIAKQEKHAKALADAKTKLEEDQKASRLSESMLVVVNGESLDIAKYSSRQLATLVEAEDLTIIEQQKPVSPYREAVRDALREKNGTPELDDQE